MRRGLFLDMDGTIADSLGALRAAYGRFLGEHGVEGTSEGFDRVNGVPLRVVVRDLQRDHGLVGDPRDLMRRFVVLIEESYLEVPPMEGALDLVDAARRSGLRLALVTSAARDFAVQWLEQADLAPHFELVVGGDSVERGKPHPEPYLHAAAELGVEVRASIAVEDSLAGAEAAVGAGLSTFVLQNRTHRITGEWPRGLAGFVRSLRDVPLEVGRVPG